MKIRTIYLNLPLHPGDLTKLRGAIVERLGREAQLFHNHAVDPDAPSPFTWDYPLIQYGVARGQAKLVGLGEGADILATKLIPELLTPWMIGGKRFEEIDFRTKSRDWKWILDMDLHQYELQGWLALNKANYRTWKQLDGDEEAQKSLLTQCLTGQLRAMGETLGMPWYKGIKAEVVELLRKKKSNWHNNDFIKFDVVIETPLQLPIGIHVGRAAAFGFGRVLSKTTERNTKQASRGIAVQKSYAHTGF